MFRGHLECVKWLVANGSDLQARDTFGRTPLDLAEEYQQLTIADFLRVCERDLADPNSTFSQMHRAHSRGWVKLFIGLSVYLCNHGFVRFLFVNKPLYVWWFLCVCVCVCVFALTISCIFTLYLKK